MPSRLPHRLTSTLSSFPPGWSNCSTTLISQPFFSDTQARLMRLSSSASILRSPKRERSRPRVAMWLIRKAGVGGQLLFSGHDVGMMRSKASTHFPQILSTSLSLFFPPTPISRASFACLSATWLSLARRSTALMAAFVSLLKRFMISSALLFSSSS